MIKSPTINSSTNGEDKFSDSSVNEHASTFNIWNALLAENENRIIEDQHVAWSYKKGAFTDHQSATELNNIVFDAAILRKEVQFEPKNIAAYKILIRHNFNILIKNDLDANLQFFLTNYWTLIIEIKLNNKNTPFVLVHMASSLDGKIATLNGHSKWIGNQENLIHAHRLRAIVDGILIGSCTVKNDKPKLTCRHVQGKNPIRLILSNNTSSFNDLPKIEGTQTYLMRNKKHQQSDYDFPFDKVIYFENEVGGSPLQGLLQQLKEMEIKSILIEGGTTTVSSFIKSGLVNLYQVHLAPILLGSGKNALVLPEIKEVNEGLAIKNSYYTPMGDSMMITGNL